MLALNVYPLLIFADRSAFIYCFLNITQYTLSYRWFKKKDLCGNNFAHFSGRVGGNVISIKSFIITILPVSIQ